MSAVYRPAGPALPPRDPAWDAFLSLHAALVPWLLGKGARLATWDREREVFSAGYHLGPNQYQPTALTVRYVPAPGDLRHAWGDRRQDANDRLMLQALTALFAKLLDAGWTVTLQPSNPTPTLYQPQLLITAIPLAVSA